MRSPNPVIVVQSPGIGYTRSHYMKSNSAFYGLACLSILRGLGWDAGAQVEIEYLKQPNQVIVSWPSALGTALEETLTLEITDSWKPIERDPVLADYRFSYTKRKTEAEKFFRLQLATGDFSEPVFYPSSNGTGIFTIGDFNGDQIADVAAVATTQLSLLLGDGTGALGDFTEKRVELSPLNISAADFNLDGKDDVVAGVVKARNETGISIFLAADGGFADSMELPVATVVPNQEFVTIAGDFNEDGKPDIMAWNAFKSVLFVGDGTGGFPTRSTILESDLIGGFNNALVGFMVCDVNDDDHLDFVARKFSERSLQAFLGDGNGGFAAATPNVFGGGTNTLRGVLGTGNFIADPGEESFDDVIVFADDEMTVAVVKGLGDGTFVEGEKFLVHESENPNIGITSAAGDFNNDGFTDFVVSSAEELPGNDVALHLDFFYNDQLGSFVRRDPVVIPAFGVDHMMTSDLNKDGKTDIIGTAGNRVVVLLGISGS